MTTPAGSANTFEPSSSPIPGPVNRTSFFEEQRRNRRATWRLSLLCIFAVVFTGIILSLILAPPIYAASLLGLAIAQKYWALPPELLQMLKDMGVIFSSILRHFSDPRWALPSTDILIFAATVILVPGILLQFVLWLGIRSLFLRAGAGGVLTTLGARAPRTEDLEEKRLVDVVDEMAIAGGVRSPKVMLLDANTANAAVIGSSSDDATVVVSRALLDELDREELQGVVAHLVGSAGNGDLRIAMTMVSVFQAFGLLTTLINAPFGPQARRTLWRLIRMSFSRNKAAEADQVSQWLIESMESSSQDDLDRMSQKSGRIAGFISTILLPVYFLNVSLKLTIWVFSSLLFEPALALMWRTRRYLADATAVQLTRNPDGLGSALQHLAQVGGPFHGGKWASHLCIVGVGGGMPPEMARRLRAIRAQYGGKITPEQMIEAAREAMAAGTFPAIYDTGNREETLDKAVGGSTAFHPPLEKRLKHLQKQGAHLSLEGKPRKTFGQRVMLAIVYLVLSPFVLFVLSALLAVVAMCIGLNLMFVMIAFAIALWLVRLIL